MVGNKNDLIELEQVTNDEGLEFAKDINALYKRTSAKDISGGIDELFKSLGKKLLDSNFEIKEENINLKQFQNDINNKRCC